MSILVQMCSEQDAVEDGAGVVVVFWWCCNQSFCCALVLHDFLLLRITIFFFLYFCIFVNASHSWLWVMDRQWSLFVDSVPGVGCAGRHCVADVFSDDG